MWTSLLHTQQANRRTSSPTGARSRQTDSWVVLRDVDMSVFVDETTSSMSAEFCMRRWYSLLDTADNRWLCAPASSLKISSSWLDIASLVREQTPSSNLPWSRKQPQSISQWIYQSISQSIIQSIYQSINQSISQSIIQSIYQSINQSVSQSINQSISQSINQSVSQSIIQSIYQSISQSIN